MIIVHHLENSRSHRILWLLEELGLDYEVKRYARNPRTLRAPPELKAVHPLGKSPVLEMDGIVLAESGAIIETMVDRFAGDISLAPPRGTPERDRYLYWLHYAEGSAMPLLLLKLVFNQVRKAPVPFFVRPIVHRIADKVSADFIDPQLADHLAYLEGQLEQNDWFVGGAFSAADIQMSFPVEAALTRAGGPPRPRLRAFLSRLEGRSAYRRAIERGGPMAIVG